MRVLGIDFGTSNTVSMLRMPDGRLRPLLFDGAPLMPTAVYLTPEGQMLVGRDAERHARVDPSRFEPNPKRRIDDGVVLLGGAELPVPRVFAAVMQQVATEARRQLGGTPEQVRLTHPARWGEQRRRLLSEAARQAGLGNPQLIAEPVAAASYFTAILRAAVPVGRALAIYDLGGGTFDATVVRRTPAGFQVLAEEGLADVGGLDFDHAIVELLGRSYSASHPDQWAALVNPTDGNARRHRRMLYEDVRAAKEMLSRVSSADVHLPVLEVDAHLTREELESLIRPYLERTVTCLARTIAGAGMAPKDLVGIFLVGGSSRIPLAAHLIHTELQVAPTTLEQPETVVVEGALCIGAPNPPVRPPMPQQQPPRPAVQQPPRPPAPQPPRYPQQPAAPVRQAPAAAPVGPAVNRPPAPVPQQPVNRPMPQTPPQPVPMPQSPAPQTQPPAQPRPVSTPPAPQQVSVPTRPAPQPPRMVPPAGPLPASVPQRAPMPAPQSGRRWYQEPAVVGTIVVLVLVVVLFVVLLILAAS
jgi:actin-like ATPase involved in cell morphogenesis